MKFIPLLERNNGFMFKPLHVGPFAMSIQASSSHYSTPRANLYEAGNYSAFEVAIFQGNNWVNPIHDERFEPLLEELKEHWESGNIAVGAYVPAGLVQKIFDSCEGVKDHD